MKVALVYQGCHRRGGVERLVWEAARYLAAHEHEVHIFAGEWDEVTPPTSGRGSLNYHRVGDGGIGPNAVRWLRFFRNSTSLVQREGFDVLNSHGVFCPLGGVHWANSVHKAWIDRSDTIHRNPLSIPSLRRRLNPLHKVIIAQERRHFLGGRGGYQKMIAASDQVKTDLHTLYQTPTNDISVVSNGLDPQTFHPAKRLAQRAEARENFGFTRNDTVMLMVANELDRKGLPVLLAAMRLLRRSDLKLVVAGRAPYAAYIPRVAAMGLSEQVFFVGSSSDVAGLHAVADFFVLPTQYEAFCLAILEALGSGLPVVTTTVPGAGDTIQPNHNGLLIKNPLDADEVAHALQTLLDDKSLLAHLQAMAATSVTPYHWDNVFRRYETILTEQVGQFSTSRRPLGPQSVTHRSDFEVKQ